MDCGQANMSVIDTSHLHIFKFMAVVFMYFCQFPRRERVTFKEDGGTLNAFRLLSQTKTTELINLSSLAD